MAAEAVTSEIDALDALMAKALRCSVSSDILGAANPGQAFLDAPVDVQRAELATVLRVEVAPQARRGTAWSPERLQLTPAVCKRVAAQAGSLLPASWGYADHSSDAT